MKRKKTSIDAHNSIKSAKGYYHQKVIDGLEKLKAGGTSAEIASIMGMTYDKVWRRMSELQGSGIVFDTGITRPLPSGRKGIVWQLTESKPEDKQLRLL